MVLQIHKSVPFSASILTALLLWRGNVQAAHNAMKETTWKPLCSLAGELRKLPAVADTSIKNLQTKAKQYEILALQLDVYLEARRDDSLETEVATLALELHTLADQKASYAKEQASATIYRVAATQQAAGDIIGTLNVFAVKPANGKFCLGNHDGTADAAARRAEYGCSSEPLTPTTTAMNIGGTIISDTGFAQMTGITDNTEWKRTGSHCVFTAHGGSHTSWTNGDQNTKLLYDLLDFSTSEQVKRTARTTISDSKGPKADILVTAFHDAKAIKADYVAQADKTTEDLITDALSSPTLQTTLEAVLQYPPLSLSTADTKSMAQSIRQSTLKADKAAAARLWKEIKDTKVVDITKADSKQTDLHKVQTEHELRRTLQFYRGQNKAAHIKQRDECKAPQEGRAGDKKDKNGPDCKNYNEQGPCEENGCKFDNSKNDGEKCFPDPEAKTDKKGREDGKTTTTSTTGSNSVLINKAPILLVIFAFLIFTLNF
uniref:Variable surface glycoprotein n=1 Tax=Trypanosoma evansi TaxID=5697 RepID=Q95NQ9_TRYEV|nr:variable surface glycoprotein [Trypanosoma evansi]AAK49464.1 variable surface glycoprotein [Trypanosoma evansi]